MSQPGEVSRESSLAADPPASLPRRQTAQQITLIDHTRPGHPEIQNPGEIQDEDDLAPESASLSRKWTKQSLQGHAQSLQGSLQGRMASRRYRHYREERFIGPEDPDNPASTDDTAATLDQGRVQRGKNKVRGLLKTRKQMQLALEEDAVIDVLYENQRGWWVFGIPHFSSKTLLNFDPKPWLNGHKKTSPVNITNAQVPDPSWEWAWASWFVDMSRDVDEEGWEYSFWFGDGMAWHGTHPFGHSWVRRRRWLRKRVRKQPQKTAQLGHALTSDYFTIHPPTAPSRASSFVIDNAARQNRLKAEDYLENPEDIRDIGSLLASLKRAAIDREKIVLVRHFIDNGSEDLHYLGSQMRTIMSLCVFQNSRQHILSLLSQKLASAESSQKEHDSHDEEISPQETQRIENLRLAIRAADDEVKRLEYWSDIRNMARQGHTAGANDETNGWDGKEWRGLDSSGPDADVGSNAKEKGKSWKQVRKEAELQLRPKASATAAPSENGKLEDGVDVGPKGEEKASEAEDAYYTTAPEDIDAQTNRDKGKQRVE